MVNDNHLEYIYKNIITHTPYAILVINNKQRIILSEGGCESILGYTKEELLGKPLEIIVPHRFRELHEKKSREFFENPRIRPMGSSIDFFALRKDGTEIPIDIALNPINVDGVFYVVSSIADITDRLNKKHELQESLNKIKVIYEQSPLGIALVDLDFKFMDVNDKFSEISGWPKEDLIGNTFMDITHEDDIETDYFQASQMKRKEIDQYTMEKRYITKSGDITWICLTVRMVYDKEGNPLYFLPIIQDINDNKKYEKDILDAKEQAEKANKTKSEFLASMSHEIRTPLNAIKGMAHLLSLSDLSSNDMRCIDVIQKSSNDLLTLINNLLDMSKIEAGVLEINESIFNINNLCNEVLNPFKQKAHDNKLFLRYHTDYSQHEFFIGDEGKIKQVLNNLISNALKFTSDGGVTLTYTCLEEGDDNALIELSVSDTGIGIKEEYKDKIFDTFVSGESGNNRKYEGSGLGLSICKKISDLMNGNIFFNTKVNKGTSFHFQLDLKKSYTNKVEVPTLIKNIQKDYPMKILVAEDNELNREDLMKFINLYGYIPDFSENGRDVLKKLEQEEYDLIFMDVKMPYKDGVETTKDIRKKFGAYPFIVALTASALEEEKQNCFNAGMNDHISKPIDPNLLAMILTRYGYKINEHHKRR